MATRRLWWRHLVSVLLAPATMTVFIPAVIVWISPVSTHPISRPRQACCRVSPVAR